MIPFDKSQYIRNVCRTCDFPQVENVRRFARNGKTPWGLMGAVPYGKILWLVKEEMRLKMHEIGLLDKTIEDV